MINFSYDDFIPLLSDFTLEFSEFEKGDFGDLKRIEFENKKKSGVIDLWSSGWLGIDVFTIPEYDQIMNIMFSPGGASKDTVIGKLVEVLNEK